MEAIVGGETQSIFQMAKIARPLMSVSRICDEGLRCVFHAEKAEVLGVDGTVICEFQRQGGFYEGRMKLTCLKNSQNEPAASPQHFARPGR